MLYVSAKRDRALGDPGVSEMRQRNNLDPRLNRFRQNSPGDVGSMNLLIGRDCATSPSMLRNEHISDPLQKKTPLLR